MKRLKLLLIVTILKAFSHQGFATTECTVHALVLYKKMHKPCKRMTILVSSAGREITAVTNGNGKCRLDFVTCDGCDPKDKSGRIYFYAVRKKGDRLLLQSFYHFPKSFKVVNDQEYKTIFMSRSNRDSYTIWKGVD